jgi:hypothetical protein
MLLGHVLARNDCLADVPILHADKSLPVIAERSEAIRARNWIAAPLRGSQ